MRNLLNRYFGRPNRRRKSSSSRLRLESLETRTLLAAVSDSGTHLTIALEDGERLEISTNGEGTQLVSLNSVLTGEDLDHPAAFSGLGTGAVSLDDLSSFETVEVYGIGEVAVVDSGENTYGHHLKISMLSTSADEADDVVFFSGQSHFANNNLVVESQRGIVFQSGSKVTVVDGSISVFSQPLGGTNSRGITVDGATIKTSGSADIRLIDRSAYELQGDPDGAAIYVTNGSLIESTSVAEDAGSIEILGLEPGRSGSSFGVTIEDSVIRSNYGRINIEDGGGDGTQDVDAGIILKNAQIESTGEGQIKIEGAGWGTGLGAGIRIDGSSVLSTGDGPILMHGVANASEDSSHGIFVSNGSSIETTSAPILLHGDNHQDQGEAHHGVELASGSTVRSDSGEIYIKGNWTGLAETNSYAVKVSTDGGASPVSVVSQSGNMTFELLGNPDASTLFLGQATTIGGSEAEGNIKFIASDFEWQNSGFVQSSGQLRFEPSSFDDLYLGGDSDGNGLSKRELGFLGDGFTEITFFLGGDTIVEDAVFLAPVVLNGYSTNMAEGTALTAPLSKISNLTLPGSLATTIDGDVEFSGELSLLGVTEGNQLNVTGRFDILDRSSLTIDWVPSSDEKNGAERTLISRNGGSGSFENTESRKGQEVLLPELLGAYLEYGESRAGDISLTIPASNSSNTPFISRPTGIESGIQTTVEWQPLQNTERYHYQLLRLRPEPTVWAEGDTESVTWTNPETLPVGRYRMWVRSEFEDGTFSRWASQGFQVSRTVPNFHFDVSSEMGLPSVTFDEVSGAVQFQVYVTNFTTQQSGIVDTIVTETAWSATESLPMGSYGLWVRAVSEDGFRSQWSDVQTHDVSPELKPLNSTPDANPTLRWNPMAGASTYEIYVAGRRNVVNETGLTSTEFQMTNAWAADYRAWVRGVTSEGRSGPWSPVITFSTDGRTQVTVTPDSEGTAFPVFEWWAVENAVEYEIYVSKAGIPGAYYRQAGITANTFQSTPLPGGDYKVWVKSYRDSGADRWSSAHSFSMTQIEGNVGQPTHLSPQGPLFNQRPTFRWSPVDGAAGYDLLLRTGEVTKVVTGITATEYTPADPITEEDAEWWVRAFDDQGRFGPFSTSASFNTSGRPVLSVASSSRPRFQWTSVIGAERYILRADNITTGQSFAVGETQLTGTTFTSGETLSAGDYRAWVRAVSSGDGSLSPWSVIVGFTVE